MDRMPVLFIGHGSPMNAIEDNGFTRAWQGIAAEIHKPEAILVVSAHWYTDGIRVTDAARPKMVYDMYGFPNELYEVQYNSPGAPALAHEAKTMIGRNVLVDNTWGYDHGAWSVLHVLYPEADIPTFQLSVDRTADAAMQYEIGRKIRALRNKGVLILGSGNVAHNLSHVDFSMEGGYDWAEKFDEYIKESVVENRHADAIDYKKAGKTAVLAVPIPDHFYPLLTVLGAADDGDTVSVTNNRCVMGSMSMTCYLFR